MNKWRQIVGFGLVTALLAGMAPGTNNRLWNSVATAQAPAPVPAKAVEAIRQAADSGDPFVEMDLLVDANQDQTALQKAIRDAGGQVELQETTYVRARVPAAVAASLPNMAGVKGVGINQELSIDPIRVTATDHVLGGTEAGQAADMNFSPMGVDGFRSDHDTQGRGIIVAVIDSGVDPGHPDLTRTIDGKPKIIDWEDFTSEGMVSTPVAVNWDTGTVTASDRREFQLPDRPDSAGAARFGYLDEQYVDGYINQDLDRNGLQIDRFGVLVVDSTGSGQFDTVYVDTNNDGSFRDEQPLTVYREGHAYGSLGQYRAGDKAATRLNFVVADVDPKGQYVKIGFDGLGHGTWVSGILGAYNPDGFTGVAPGVQIMALKALNSTSSGRWFDIKRAIEYAATHGASIINLSVGDLATGAAKEFDTGASEWLNQIATKYGVLIVLAAGNSGPGLSSGSTLGSPSLVLAAGAYFSPDMWKRDYGWVVPHESVWFFSGMGPRSDGTYLPSLIAPGGSPAPSPLWRDATGYTTADGTSVATPHVSGAAALLMEAGRRAGVRSDWLSVKQALEMGARRIAGFQVYEQGSGLVQLEASFNHLQQIQAFPGLTASTYDGNGGVLARNYAPGSTAFSLSNNGSDLERVSIYSSESWVHPAFTSLLLPPGGVKRELPLQIDPPQDPGAHSAFLTVTRQQRYGSNLLLPVTHVQPVDLNAANSYDYGAAEALEAGRYHRYFVNVPPDMSQLTVTSRVPSGQSSGSGTVQVDVFRPDGQAVHSGQIGVAGNGLTALFQTSEPVPGVWEVVVVALPDRQAENSRPYYSLDVQARPGALGGAQPLHLVVPAGSTTTVPIKAMNVFGTAFTGNLQVLGLVKSAPEDLWSVSVPWTVKPTTSSVVETFRLKDVTDLLQLEIDNPVRAGTTAVDTGNTDLTLSLYHYNINNQWELMQQSATPGSSHETIKRENLPAGTYQAVVTANNDAPVQFQYRRLMGVDRSGLQMQDDPRPHPVSDTWTAAMTIKAPSEPGRYEGQILLKDTLQSRILGWYPIEISVGQPVLRIQPMVAQLTKGQLANVVLTLRDSRSNQPVSGVEIKVNGQRYLSGNGQVSVPVVPDGDTKTLEVEADLPAYQYVKEQFTLPVRSSWALYPMGVDANQENQSWRRKVTTQLP